jgi:hypothetical protein
MADYKTSLEDAIIKAHEAQDFDGAKVLAEELKSFNSKQSNSNPVESPKQGRSLGQEVGRQTVGLPARYIAESLADTVGIFSDPLAGLSNRFLGTNLKTARGAVSGLLDSAGFPIPETKTERVVAEPSRLLAGTGGFIKGANAVGKYGGEVVNAAMKQISSQPLLQGASATGAGTAGGYVKESGGNELAQLAATVAGGVLAPASIYGLKAGGGAIVNALKPNTDDLAMRATQAINNAGIDENKLSTQATLQLKQAVEKALKTDGDLSPDAIRRLADYNNVGATPMRGNLTLNPVDITQDKNLAKLGANSNNSYAQQLPLMQDQNKQALIRGVNDLGASTTDDAFAGGQKIIGALQSKDARAKNVIGALYNRARDTSGRSAELSPNAFANKANDLLDQNLLGGKLPSDVRNTLNGISKGEIPLTVDVAEQLKTSIGNLQRGEADGGVRRALGLVRQALDDTPLKEGSEVGQKAINAFNRARRVNRSYMEIVDSTPALKAVRDGIEPDKFVQQFIVGNGSKSNIKDVNALKSAVEKSPEALQSVREQIVSHLKNKALNGGADEVSNFSASNYNKALNAVDRKLNLFFNEQEIEKLKAIGRVSSYESFQPTGAAVNNSNTASGLLSPIMDLIAKVPFGKAVAVDPINNIMAGRGAKNTLDTAKALAFQSKKGSLDLPVYPLLMGSGALSTE